MPPVEPCPKIDFAFREVDILSQELMAYVTLILKSNPHTTGQILRKSE